MRTSGKPPPPGRPAAVLEERRAELLSRWRRRVRQDPRLPLAHTMDEAALSGHIPDLIDRIIACLESMDRDSRRPPSNAVTPDIQRQKRHAQDRYDAGYSAAEAVMELVQLRTAILEVLLENRTPLTYALVGTIDAVLDGAIVATTAELGSRLTLHRLEERHRLERERLRSVLEQSGDGICVIDERGVVRLTNPEIRRQIGQDLRDLHMEDALKRCSLFTPEGTPLSLEETPIFRALHGERASGIELHVLRPDGSIRILMASASPLRHPDGSEAGVVIIARDETESRQRQQALLTDAERIRLLLDGVTDYALVMLDPDGRIVRWNAGATRITGFESSEILGQHFSILYPPDQRAPGTLRGYLEAAASQGRFEHGGPHLLRNERTFQADEVITPLRDSAGRLCGYALVIQDITKRKHAEEALKRSEARVRRLVESNVIGTIVGDQAGAIKEANDAFLTLLGYSRDELNAGRLQWIDLMPPELLTRAETAIDELNRTGTCTPFELEFLRTDGGRVPVLMGAASLESSQGEFIGFVLDLSERKQSEAERARLLEREREARAQAEAAQRRFAFLAEANIRLSESLEYEAGMQKLAELAVPQLADWCLVHRLDKSGWLQGVAVAHPDPARAQWARELLPRFPQSAVGDSAYARVVQTGKPELSQQISPEILSLMAKNHDPEYLRILLGLDLRSYIVLPLSARGRVLGVLTFLTAESGRVYGPDDLVITGDLAHRAALALDNARLYQEAHEAVCALEEFLSIASHELRTPITAIALQVQLLQRKYGGEEFARLTPAALNQAMDGLRRQIGRLTALIDNLLDLSHLSAGRLELELASCDLTDIVHDVTGRLRESLDRAQCRLILHLAGPVQGVWDRFRLEQVLTNLLTNAMKYGQGQPIEISAVTRNSTAVLAVRDYGIGIEPEAQAEIFERYKRAASSHKGTSLGLGLYISQQIVASHGGSIRVESEPGKGATFIVELPRAGPDAQGDVHA